MWDKWPWFNREPERHERPGKKAMGLRIGELGTIEIGVQGECDAREIVLDVTEWLEVWPDAVFLITHRRPTEYAAYNVANTEIRDGGALVWTVSAEDVAIAGRGEIQVRAYEGDTLVKSISGRTVIRPGVGAGEEPADATDWLEKVSKAGAEATKGAEDALEIATRLTQILYGVLNENVFTGTKEEWEAFLDGLVNSLQQAQNAADAAESSATQIEGMMEDAENFRDEYADDLAALAVALKSIIHKVTEDPDGWVTMEMEGLQADAIANFPTVSQLNELIDDLRTAITRATTAKTEADALVAAIQTKLTNHEFDGKDGKNGSVILGTYPTLDALNAAVRNPQAGDAYGIGTNKNYEVYVYDGVKFEWVSWGFNTGGNQGIDESQFNTLFDARFGDSFDTATEGTEFQTMLDNKIQTKLDATVQTAFDTMVQSAAFRDMLENKISELMSASFRNAMKTEMDLVQDPTNKSAADVKAFRQAVYDTMFPVGFSFCTSYRDTRLAAYKEDHTDVIEWNPTTMATALGVTATWQRKYDSLMGYVNGVQKYAVGLVRFYRTA